MRFARWVFLLAGVSGALLVVPPYFLERRAGEDYPPPVTHPDWLVLFVVAYLRTPEWPPPGGRP